MTTVTLDQQTPPASPCRDLVSSLLLDAERETEAKRTDRSEVWGRALSRSRADATSRERLRSDDGGFQAGSLSPAQVVAEWYLQGRTGLEELFLQLYFGRHSLAEVESVAGQLWGKAEGVGLVHTLAPDIIGRIDRWLSRSIPDFHPYVFLRSIDLRPRGIPEGMGIRVAAAVGINQSGYREILGLAAESGGSAALWESLLTTLRARGMPAPVMAVGENDGALRAVVGRCWGDGIFMTPPGELAEDILGKVSAADIHWVQREIAGLEVCANTPQAEQLGAGLLGKLKQAGYSRITKETVEGLHGHLTGYGLPAGHWARLCNSRVVRSELNRVRQQGRTLGPIQDERAILLLAAASFRRQERILWNAKRFLPPA